MVAVSRLSSGLSNQLLYQHSCGGFWPSLCLASAQGEHALCPCKGMAGSPQVCPQKYCCHSARWCQTELDCPSFSAEKFRLECTYAPPPPEDPEPEDGNPHPLYGADATAEQIYQNLLANWLQLNLNHNVQYNNLGHQHNGQGQHNIPPVIQADNLQWTMSKDQFRCSLTLLW